VSDYFSTVRQGLGDAVERRAHLRWYRRVRLSHGRALAVVFAALVIAAPAAAAVSGWFSFGKPNVPPHINAGAMFGLLKPGSSRLLSLRTPDPAGGPAWGLRLVKTSRGDTCVQLGRVEERQLGSLGIDDAWNNDHRFHVISPKDSPADECGATDAAGYGYLSGDILGEQASANIFHQGQKGRDSGGCAPPQYMFLVSIRHHPLHFPNHAPSTPGCPASGARVVFYGLLGPDATSITYRKPGGVLATERTSGGVGAYLLVFPYNEETCYQYSHSANRIVSCDSDSQGDVSPGQLGAVMKITYRDGHSCSVQPSARVIAAYKAFEGRVLATLGRPKVRQVAGRPHYPARWLARYEAMLTAFLRREHLTQTQLRREFGGFATCPPVGWVASRGPRVTRADVATPIVVREFRAGYSCPKQLNDAQGCDGVSPHEARRGVPVEWSFKARRAVTNSRSWYEWSISPESGQHGTNCYGSSFATYNNIREGQVLRYSEFVPSHCRGTYSIAVGFTASAPPTQADDNGGGTPGYDGSLLVGRATFTIH
jgi:hypothetical protein